jgi:ParB family transcriptional regulator, chromosome partitioning protein
MVLSHISPIQGLFQELLVKELRPSRNLLRVNNNNDANCLESISQLAASVMEKGLLQPIIVRQMHNNGYFEIIAGHRRFEACKLLGWSKIMCHLVEVDDKEAYEISLLENIQQKSMNPMEEARAFKKYVDTFGWGGESDLAQKISKTQEYISRRIRLLSLPQDMQDEIMRCRITLSMAQELFALHDDSESLQHVSQYIKESNPTSREVRQIIKVVSRSPQQFRELFSNRLEDNYYYYNKNNMRETDSIEEISKLSNSMFKKSILSIRIAIKTIDIMLDELVEEEEEEEEHSEDLAHNRQRRIIDEDDLYYRKWFLKEILMQHRLRLHEQIDVLVKQQHKAKRAMATI